MRTLTSPPAGRTDRTIASNSEAPALSIFDKHFLPHPPLETPQRYASPPATVAALAVLMAMGAGSSAEAQFICQQYGGSFGGATAGSQAIACGNAANASGIGSTAFGNQTQATTSYAIGVGNFSRSEGANSSAITPI